jgi:hypothetical protein
MKRVIQLLPAGMLECINGVAEQPTPSFDFRAITRSGMTIRQMTLLGLLGVLPLGVFAQQQPTQQTQVPPAAKGWTWKQLQQKLQQQKPIAQATGKSAAAAKPVVAPAAQPVTPHVMKISGVLFDGEKTIGSATLSRTGEVAFNAFWMEGGHSAGGVFTGRRLVARAGETIEGHVIVAMPLDVRVAISENGTVIAYAAIFQDSPGGPSRLGLFCERHLAALAVFDGEGNVLPFAVSDDGVVSIAPAAPVAGH